MTEPTSPPRWRRLALRLVVLASLAAWIVAIAGGDDILAALGQVPLEHFLLGCALALVNQALAAARWGVMLAAFGAQGRPPALRLFALVLVGHFYNTFVPGSVGGDVVRGVIARRHFDRPATSYLIVALERVLGLAGVLVLLAVGMALSPPRLDLTPWWPWIGAAVGAGALVTALLLMWSGLRRKLAAVIGRYVQKVIWPAGVGWGLALSTVSNGLSVIVTWIIGLGMGLGLSLVDMLFAVPLMLIGGILPITVAGIGPREASLMAVLAWMGVPAASAVALSLAFASTYYVAALIGGGLALRGRYSVFSDAEGPR